jgi:hypothetical protein
MPDLRRLFPDDPRTLWRITVKEPAHAATAVLAPTFAAAAMPPQGARHSPTGTP